MTGRKLSFHFPSLQQASDSGHFAESREGVMSAFLRFFCPKLRCQNLALPFVILAAYV